MTILKAFLAIAGLVVFSGVAMAGSLPVYYPESFQSTGTVDRLDLSAGEVVIGDRLYRITTGTAVHTLRSNVSSTGALATGMLVGLDSIRDIPGAPFVTNIWELPDTFSPIRR
ncbi:MAG: hypothetical protein FD165_107 [Gammaproteobacteria bacterium]|nr:MAG: hypothetical protein FD165_107 [Gammaproteobacteria bacterium]TND06685.1 MAG: hypothetical protein FD120_417 [Gammaproteobacteria bacterium]